MKLIHSSKPEKKAQIERLLGHGTVMCFIDTRVAGVSVPSHFMGNPQLALNFDYAYHIPDFKVTEERIEATLEFGTLYFFCVIPLDAIYSVRSDFKKEMVVFNEDVPKDFLTSAPPPPKPNLTSVKNTKTPMEPPPEPALKPKKKGHLKLVE